MMSYPAGPRNSLTDVPGVRVSHLTRVESAGGGRPVRTGLTAIFTCPPEGRRARPAAIVAVGGRTEVTGLNYVDDFGFVTNPIVATGLRSLGRVYDALLSRRTQVALGWPPMLVGLDDGRLSDPRRAVFTEEDVATMLDAASDDKVQEGAVGAGAGLVAFGYKSGVGSASRQIAVDNGTYIVGTLALLNLGRRDALRVGGTPVGSDLGPPAGPPALSGSALIVVATDAPLDDRQCRRVAEATLQGLGRLGAVPGLREGLVAWGVSTGVLLTRGDRSASQIELPHSSDTVVAAMADAAAEAAEDAGLRTLTTVAPDDGTPEYPAMPIDRVRRLVPGQLF